MTGSPFVILACPVNDDLWSVMTGCPLMDILFIILECLVSDDWSPPDLCFIYYSSVSSDR